MAGTIQKEPPGSQEPIATATAGNPRGAATTPDYAGTDNAWHILKQALETDMEALLEVARTPGYPSLAECASILKRTWRLCLFAVGAIVVLMAVAAVAASLYQHARKAREVRIEEAVASATPERLIARCGQPAKDVTKVFYPLLVRMMSYQPEGSQESVLVFTRTAEEKSDWVFLSMKDESGTRSYDTPDAKIAALPCLDSKK
jgi:hypothetical protein